MRAKKCKADKVCAKKAKKNVNARANPFVDGRKTTSTTKLNPFEVHVNRQKFDILGRVCKHDKGLPGVSRTKAHKRRTATLGEEYLTVNKNNKLVDKRIGRKYDGSQVPESVLNARYLADKLSQVKHKRDVPAAQLNDDEEILTHRGQMLADLEQFRDQRDHDDDDDEEEDEELVRDMTAANFGGEHGNDRQAAYDEIIAKSKRNKLEQAHLKAEVAELTAQLDADYKNMLPLIVANKRDESVKQAPDAFDKLIKELIFEPRGGVSDRMPSEAEQARLEKERLQQLEEERLQRMRGDDVEAGTSAKLNLRSADDLDDGYYRIDESDDEDALLTYDDAGNLMTATGKREVKKDFEFDYEADIREEESDAEEGGQSADSGSDDESDDDDDLADLRLETESESEDNYDQIKEKEAEDDEDQEDEDEDDHEVAPTKTTKSVSKSLPYVFEIPKSYERFSKLLAGHTTADQITIVDRVVKSNQPQSSKREAFVDLLGQMLEYLKRCFNEATEANVSTAFTLLNGFSPLMYGILKHGAVPASVLFLDEIKALHAEGLAQPNAYPSLWAIVYLKLVANFYSTSDFRHGIVTACTLYMESVLTHAAVNGRSDITRGLFICTVALQFGRVSRRFLPVVLEYLYGVVFLSIPARHSTSLESLPVFQQAGGTSQLLMVSKHEDASALEEQLLGGVDCLASENSLDFRVRALHTCLGLIADCIGHIELHVGAQLVVGKFLALFKHLKLGSYPAYVRQRLQTALGALKSVATRKLQRLVPPARKPKALRLLTPRFELVTDDKRRPKTSKVKEEQAKWRHKIKREQKGAMRDLRRDTEYLQELRIKKQIQSDQERREKVKRIYQEAAIQQGDLNELDRAKKRKKF